MRNNETGKIADALIGEAVMELLERNDAIGFDTMVQALREASMRPENRARAKEYAAAIADVRNYMAQASKQKQPAAGLWATSEVKGWHLNEPLSGSDEKKH
ncbi:hypothetical protein EDF81_0488 [Enterobacter sp. BIGb0383]|uniref:hypothetical protein n=1 Tax=unclassified Enterobacter TaxID=2608935 RepID=UPI000F4ADACF|nr:MULTISPECIES: hypothetical protein [unclassified Enterobacter]ROP62009.1 hypothetical protein EDF81_0488 [Enterobacter sp. BIGb0383]ROS12170.1 hypothetical protein EC848_0489 [Enterobacter sp. BIGb0359]